METDWMWNPTRLRELLDTCSDVFLAGATSNQHEFYPLFAKIFILTIDATTLTQRLQNRQPGDYGMHPKELQEILRTFEGFTRRTIGKLTEGWEFTLKDGTCHFDTWMVHRLKVRPFFGPRVAMV